MSSLRTVLIRRLVSAYMYLIVLFVVSDAILPDFDPRDARDAELGSRRLKMEIRLPFSDRWRVSNEPTTPNHYYENSVYVSVRVSFKP